MTDLHQKLTQHTRLLAALITAAVLLSVAIPAADASPGMGRQTPPPEGDIDDYPFLTDPDSGGDEVAHALEGLPPHGWWDGGDSEQNLLIPDQAAAQARTAGIC